jgi:spermidine synthase
VTGRTAVLIQQDVSGKLVSVRNFYGPLRVTQVPVPSPKGDILQLRNGNIVHGREFIDRDLYCEPISYYAPNSGIGVAIAEKRSSGPLKIGVVGLGSGAMAAYGRDGDEFRFYEINPLVPMIASSTFHFLSACPAKWTIAMGDARLSLEREAPQGFDVLVVDAFTSDAIPAHLLTKEALAVYWKHLKPDGVLAVHVSNQYIDLAPVVVAAAQDGGKAARLVDNNSEAENAIDESHWVLVASSDEFFTRLGLSAAKQVAAGTASAWTDDYSNLWRALK